MSLFYICTVNETEMTSEMCSKTLLSKTEGREAGVARIVRCQ